jgi:hypothetical protein
LQGADVADKTNADRLLDLKAALASTKASSVLSLADCAALWGVTKPRFVNKRAEISGFPDASVVEGNAHFYPAKSAIKAMIAHLERHQQAQAARLQSQSRLLGRGGQADALAHHTPAELATLNRLRADLEADERKQGIYCPIADQQQIAGEVFSEISEFCSTLSNQIDPHGRLEPEIRNAIDTKAHEALLKFHARMKGLLSGDALPERTRAADRSARKPRARRQR